MKSPFIITRTLLVLCLLMTLGFFANLATAQVRIVGVSAGDSFKHSVTFNWSSTDPNATIPSYYQSLNETEWTSISIISVSSTNVTGQMTMHFKNGTESVQAGITDVDSGDGNMTIWVVAANLNQSDTIYTSSIYSNWAINETVVRNYLGGTRNTNHLNMTAENNVTGVYQYRSSNYYWDKSTGVMVETSMAMVTQTNVSQMNVSAALTITESNVWIVPEFPTSTSIQLILIVLTITVLPVKRRLSKK